MPNKPVYTLINECHDCYKCVRECHVKAIKIEDGHASVLSEKCIACGSCVKACPSEAKRVRSDVDKVKNLFLAQQKVVVSLAPSWIGSFDCSEGQIISALKKLGFFGVSETALGAQEVSVKTAQTLNEAQNGVFISSACPVMVDYIRLCKSEYTKNITPVASPALTHAKMLKETYGESVCVVFIGPCVGKKNEADLHPELISATLTFEELKIWLKDEEIDANSITAGNDAVFIPERAFEGALYPIDGGMNETIRRIGIKENIQLLDICGLPSMEKALGEFDTDKVIFIEALACEGGCIQGPCMASKKAGLKAISDTLSSVVYRDVIPKTPKTVVELEYMPNPVKDLEYPLEQVMKTLKKIGKHSSEDELNCGGCGYPTCRELANALIAGLAEPSMCVSYMRKIAMRKAAALLRCMPSSMVMVDSELKIVEANDAFLRMFTGEMYDVFTARPEGLQGAALDRIVDFGNIFKATLNSEKDIHKERYPYKGKLYDIHAFNIEQNELAGAIITDVTQTEATREQIAQKAQEVISKNISIVQEIACLLGEHMVETETLLSSIANDYDKESE